jgi:hypothetical protein
MATGILNLGARRPGHCNSEEIRHATLQVGNWVSGVPKSVWTFRKRHKCLANAGNRTMIPRSLSSEPSQYNDRAKDHYLRWHIPGSTLENHENVSAQPVSSLSTEPRRCWILSSRTACSVMGWLRIQTSG